MRAASPVATAERPISQTGTFLSKLEIQIYTLIFYYGSRLLFLCPVLFVALNNFVCDF